MISLYILMFYLFVYGKLKFLDNRILSFFGSISYCLYLVHQEAGKQVYAFLTNNVGLKSSSSVILLILMMIGISALVTYGIEKPSIRFIRRKLLKKDPLAMEVALTKKAV